MKISFIVVNYKTTELLKVCVNSIIKNNGPFIYEIIVVDMESDGEAEFALENQNGPIKVISEQKNLGYAGGVNIGMRKASGDYFFILNTDIVLKKESVEKLVDLMEKNKKIGIAGPQLINFNDTAQSSAFDFYSIPVILYRRTFLKKFVFAQKALDKFLLKEKLKNAQNSRGKFYEVGWIMGSAMFTRREAIREVGFMDERFFMYFEDVDWCARFWKQGFLVVYFPDAKVYHHHIKGSKGNLLFNKLARIHIKSAFKYFRKYGFDFFSKNS